ncbi:TonB-dependent receptor domain-containing protein [Pseudoalteromonas piscicida]|uniref:TonB-dependent receptor domain-containing protein n=1 Tax=Pseudoalteromonas piscicida TaxID=43662 RepID=UPI0030A376F9
MIKNNKISIGVKLALLGTSLSTLSAATYAEEAEVEEIERVQVTGSRIKRAEIEGPSPITVISADYISDQGFNNVYEAVQSLTSATGTIQGQGYTNSFTPNAETVNLRGLGPNRTLVLLNGRRVANYPRAFNGQNNVFNLSTIPTAAIKQIEVVTGGNSAIYGSDAMAGVVNIITKDEVEDITVTARHSTTTQGGGSNDKFTITGGWSGNDMNFTYSFDYVKQDMLTGHERSWLDSYDDGPATHDQAEHTVVDGRVIMAANWAPGFAYTHPDEYGDNVCGRFDDLRLSNRPSRGFYCGRDLTGFGSYINQRESYSLYTHFNWDFSADHRFFAEALYWDSKAANQGGYGAFWSSQRTPPGGNQGGWVLNAADNNERLYLQRYFPKSETGDDKGRFEDKMGYFAVGFKGTILGDYNYEVSLSHSAADNYEYEYLVASDKATKYFLGTPIAGLDNNMTYDVTSEMMERFWNPIPKADRDQLFELNDSEADASVTMFNASLTGDLFELPAGFVAFATSFEWGSEDYDINIDPRTMDPNLGWGNGLTGVEGNGERDRYGLAVEFDVPVTEQVTLNLAGRYDYYDDETEVDGAFTYQIGLQYRPTDALLLRANYGTTFRAPDINQVFAGESGSYSSFNDYWLEGKCLDLANGRDTGFNETDLAALAYQCDADKPGELREGQSAYAEKSGNFGLKEETGYSATVGFVWDITDDMSWAFDLYEIEVEGQVETWSNTHFFKNEALCRNGQGTNESLCADILSRVERWDGSVANEGLTVKEMRTTYFNQAVNSIRGFDTNYKYSYDAGEWGELSAELRYTHVLEVVRQEFPGDEIDKDYRDDHDNSDLRSKFDNSFAWKKGDWRITLQQIRYGSLWNYESNDPDENPNDERRALSARMKPWLIYNLGVNYAINDNHKLRFGINNLRDTRPRNDGSFNGSAPWFNRSQYPVTIGVMGRQLSLEYTGTF